MSFYDAMWRFLASKNRYASSPGKLLLTKSNKCLCGTMFVHNLLRLTFTTVGRRDIRNRIMVLCTVG